MPRRRSPTALLRARRLRALAQLGFQRLPLRQRLVQGLEHGALGAIAAVFAYVPAQLLGLRESFWSAITALAVVQTEIQMARSTARDQFTGAAIGGIAGVAIVVAFGTSLPAYMFAIIASILAAWALGLPTAARLAAITATIILLVPHMGTVEHMMIARVSEVAWGVVVAIAVVSLMQLLRRETGWERESQ